MFRHHGGEPLDPLVDPVQKLALNKEVVLDATQVFLDASHALLVQFKAAFHLLQGHSYTPRFAGRDTSALTFSQFGTRFARPFENPVKPP